MRNCHLAGVTAGLTLLAGCGELQNPLSFFGSPPETSISVLDGAVTVVGPEGFCIDGRTSAAKTGFAVIAPCPVLQGVPAERHAVGTVQVGDAETASVNVDVSAMASFLQSDDGRGLLSANGDVDDLRVTATDSMVVATFEDTSAPSLEGLSNQEARAFFDINGRLVTVAYRGIRAQPLALDTVSQLVEVTVEAMRSANATAPESNS